MARKRAHRSASERRARIMRSYRGDLVRLAGFPSRSNSKQRSQPFPISPSLAVPPPKGPQVPIDDFPDIRWQCMASKKLNHSRGVGRGIEMAEIVSRRIGAEPLEHLHVARLGRLFYGVHPRKRSSSVASPSSSVKRGYSRLSAGACGSAPAQRHSATPFLVPLTGMMCKRHVELYLKRSVTLTRSGSAPHSNSRLMRSQRRALNDRIKRAIAFQVWIVAVAKEKEEQSLVSRIQSNFQYGDHLPLLRNAGRCL